MWVATRGFRRTPSKLPNVGIGVRLPGVACGPTMLEYLGMRLVAWVYA